MWLTIIKTGAQQQLKDRDRQCPTRAVFSD